MAFSVSYIYEILDRYSAPLKRIDEQTQRFRAHAAATAEKARALSDSLVRVGQSATKIGGRLSAAVTLPLLGLGTAAIIGAAKMETLQVAFEVMLGSADRARKMVADLAAFSAKTPFEMEGITQSARTLMAFNVHADKVIPTLSMLGDIAAGTNVPLEDISQIFGKIKAKGRLMTEELMQLSERGVPVVAKLAEVIQKKYGVSAEEAQKAVFKMAEKGQLSFGALEMTLSSMTQKGGLFFQMMEKQSHTLSGMWSTLKDNVTLAMAGVGEVIVREFDLKDKMKSAIEAIGKMADKLNKFIENNPGLAKNILLFVGLLAALGPVLAVVGLVSQGFGFLMTIFSAISLPVIAVVAGVAALVAIFMRWISTGNPVIDALKRMSSLLDPLYDLVIVLLTPFKKFAMWMFDAKDGADALTKAVDFLGLILTPVISGATILMRGLIGVLHAAALAITGDFSGAWKVLKETGHDIKTEFDAASKSIDDYMKKGKEVSSTARIRLPKLTAAEKTAGKLISGFTPSTALAGTMFSTPVSAGATPTMDAANSAIFGLGSKTAPVAAKQQAASTEIAASGNITVTATPGTSVRQASIKLNSGSNVATAR